MHIMIIWHDKQFNVDIAASEQREAFLSIKGCRLVEGSSGTFVSFPSRKNEQTGKYWNHVWANPAFQAEIVKHAKASQQQASKANEPFDKDEIPF